MDPKIEELIDQHLSGRISADDQIKLEQALEQDNSLKEEFDFQKSVASALKQERRLQLKSKLDAIPVSAGLSKWKKAVIAGLAALMTAGGGALYYNSTTGENESIVEINQQKKQPASDVADKPTSKSMADEAEETISIEEKPSKEAEMSVEKDQAVGHTQHEETISIKETTPTQNQGDTSPGKSNIADDGPRTPQMHDFDDPHDEVGEKGNDAPENSFTAEESQKKYTEPKIVKNNNAFKYLYDGENLTLFGDFDRSTPYYLIELNRNKDIYLKYKGTYYRIEKSSQKALLEDFEVTDQSVINKLNDAE